MSIVGTRWRFILLLDDPACLKPELLRIPVYVGISGRIAQVKSTRGAGGDCGAGA